MYEGRMARLDPYLGQSLKEIVPNADAVLTFVGMSHDILRYDAQFSLQLIYIVARYRDRENTGQREQEQEVWMWPRRASYWPRMAWFSLGSGATYHISSAPRK
jgi:hypothetical protein